MPDRVLVVMLLQTGASCLNLGGYRAKSYYLMDCESCTSVTTP